MAALTAAQQRRANNYAGTAVRDTTHPSITAIKADQTITAGNDGRDSEDIKGSPRTTV